MNNYVQKGEVVTAVAPKDLASGEGVLIGRLFVVATAPAALGETFEGMTSGVFRMAKTEAQAWDVWSDVYWNEEDGVCDNDPVTGPLIGVATAAAANPSTEGIVRLNGTVSDALVGATEPLPDLEDETDAGENDNVLENGCTADVPEALTALALDNEIVASADPENDVVAVTIANGTLVGVANGAFALVGNTSTGDRSAEIMDNFKEVQSALANTQADLATIAATVNALRTDLEAVRAALSSCGDDQGATNSNISDLGHQMNEIIARLRNRGIVAPNP